MTELIVSYKSNNYKHEAFDLAQRLEVECLSHEESKEVEDHINVYFLIVNKSNHYLRKGLSRKYKPIFCNFSDWATNYSDPLLTKCLKGLPDGFRAVDTTAGFGKDALQIAKDIRCKNVTLIEKEPWMFHLLKDSYNKLEDNVTSVYVNKFKILNMDSKNFLDKNKEPYDLIYIDPMFSGVGKSKAKKTLQTLRELTTQNKQSNLLGAAIASLPRRVVVKRHKNSNHLEGRVPNYSISGKVVRYDIYNLNS